MIKLDKLWDQFLLRKVDEKVFEEHFDHNGCYITNHFEYPEDIYFNLAATLNDHDRVESITVYKAKMLYRGHGRPVDKQLSLTKKDVINVSSILEKCCPNRFSKQMDEILTTIIEKQASYDGFKIHSIKKNRIFFLSDKKVKISIPISIVKKAIEISNVFLDPFFNDEFFFVNSDYFGEKNIPLLLAIFRVIDPTNFDNYSDLLLQYEQRELINAIQNNDLAKAMEFSDAIIYDKSALFSVGTPLVTAIKNRNVDIVKWLIANGANVNRQVNSTTPLEWAIGEKNDEIINALVYSKKITAEGPIKDNIKDYKYIKIMLELGFTLRSSNYYKKIEGGKLEIIEEFLPYKVEYPNKLWHQLIEDNEFEKIDKVAMTLKENTEQVKLMEVLAEKSIHGLFSKYIKSGFCIDSEKLFYICYPNPDLRLLLIDNGYNFMRFGSDLLYKYTDERNVEVCCFLLSMNSPVTYQVLNQASYELSNFGTYNWDWEDCLKRLIDVADDEVFFSQYCSAVEKIFCGGSENICKYLIERLSSRIDEKVFYYNRWVGLLELAIHIRLADDGVVEYLQIRGLNADDTTNAFSSRFYSVLIQKHKMNALVSLLSYGYIISKEIDVSCVAIAVESGAVEICKMLFEMGYSPNDKHYGKTALDILNESKDYKTKVAAPQMKKLLLEYGAKTSSELNMEEKIYTVKEAEGWFYIYENQNVMRSENGYFQVKTSYKELAIRVVKDLNEYGKNFDSPESIAYYHLTAINDFIVRLDKGRHIDFMKSEFLISKDFLLSSTHDKEEDGDLRYWFYSISTTQACAVYCLAKWCNNIYAVFKFAQLLESTGSLVNSYINSIYKENSIDEKLSKRSFENFAYYYLLS